MANSILKIYHIHGYPLNWDDIANEIKDQARWQCEHCGHPHDPEYGYTLTVHHLDGNLPDCRYKNLVALCQRCHLHIQNTYWPGQLMLVEPWPWAVARGLM